MEILFISFMFLISFKIFYLRQTNVFLMVSNHAYLLFNPTFYHSVSFNFTYNISDNKKTVEIFPCLFFNIYIFSGCQAVSDRVLF